MLWDVQVLVSVDGKGDAVHMPSNSTNSSAPDGVGNGRNLFMVNITASPSAALLLDDVSPGNLSTTGVTLIKLAVVNLPSYVLSDHSGEVGGTLPQMSSSSSAAISDVGSLSCTPWLTVTIAGIACPILGCSGSSSAARVTALFPGHMVNQSAFTHEQHGLATAVLTVANAAGSYTVTRRKLAALRHPPVLSIPFTPGGAAACQQVDSNQTAGNQEAMDLNEHPPFMSEVTLEAVEALTSMIVAASHKGKHWLVMAAQSLQSRLTDAVSHLRLPWKVGRPPSKFRQMIQLEAHNKVDAQQQQHGPGQESQWRYQTWGSVDASRARAQAARPLHKEELPRRRLLAAVDGQSLIISEATFTVSLVVGPAEGSPAAPAVVVQEPSSLELRSYGLTTVMFEVQQPHYVRDAMLQCSVLNAFTFSCTSWLSHGCFCYDTTAFLLL